MATLGACILFHIYSYTIKTKESVNEFLRIIQMPLKIVRKGNEYAVKNVMSGKTHGYTTKTKAEAQMRLLQAIDHGFVPRKIVGKK